MTDRALYKQLDKYNSQQENAYRNHWGSLLTFVDNKDIKQL